MSARRPSDDEVDRLLRDALADDLPAGLERELRREARIAWRRTASPPRRAWHDWLGIPATGKALLPQPALVVAALAMLGAGAVMQAAPPPPAVVESFQGHEAAALTARALERARAMECVVEAADAGGQRTTFRIDWRAPSETRVRFDAGAGPAERTLRLPGARPSVLKSAAERGAPLDPALEPVRAYLSPAALGERLAAGWRRATGRAAQGAETFLVGPRSGSTGLTVAIDDATHLPVGLDAADRGGRTQAAVCRWR